MAVEMRRVRRQIAFNGRGGRAKPNARVILLCLVVYIATVCACPPELSIKASAMAARSGGLEFGHHAGRGRVSRGAPD